MARGKVAIIGTGMIGSSLAVLATGNGYPVTVYARSAASKEKCEAQVGRFFNALMEKGLVTEAQAAACRKLLSFTDSYAGLADAELVIEGVAENLSTKQEVFRELEANLVGPGAIISTTSALDVEELAAGFTKYADRFLVAHPFFPPHLIPFVEVVKSSRTTEDALRTAVDMLEDCGREVVVLKKNAPGFLANRLQHALFREALHIVEEGIADPRDVDKAAMYSFMPRYTSIGLFEHFDNSGVDLNFNIENYLFKELSAADRAPKIVCDLVEKGDLGVKTGKGMYDWSETDMEDFAARISAPYWKYFDWKLPES